MARNHAVRRRRREVPARRGGGAPPRPRAEGRGIVERRVGRASRQVAPPSGLGVAALRRLRLPRAAGPRRR